MRSLLLLVLAVLLSASLPAQTIPQAARPDLVLNGTVEGKQNNTHFEIPFTVPANIHRISVDFSYTGKEQKTVLNLGVEDPERFRGNSGGNKSHFTISETDATPSYLPGAIPPGTWKLLISVPNIRPAETAHYHAEIRFNNPVEDESFTLHPLEEARRGYRGDLHMHTAHSDGSCLSQSGKKVPCPLFFTAQSAANRGLDFIAITDHNTGSQFNDERELQPYFDKLLLIPGREMTTFWGHFNIYGVTQFIDYRAVAPDDTLSEPKGSHLDINAILRDVRAKGGIASLNHADSPTGELCMGCGWNPPFDIDMSLFTGIEVINGGGAYLSSADFWDRQLAREITTGATLTAIGGSDNHNALFSPGHSGAIAWPTTVVEADNLSVPAILDGIRHGRVFIDLTASHDKILDLSVQNSSSHKQAIMGGALNASAGDDLVFTISLTGCPHSSVHIFLDGKESSALPTVTTPIAEPATQQTLSFQWKTDGHPHWLRAEVRDSNQKLMLVSNPIYIRVY
ncbi:MAG TPA: CehA/McbA family metallohydrolase [Acidobacteriaceae bacterium]|nr:CehA/McbA family metallohydrolase [Acidobacteriaceae bacterium]